MGHKHTRNHVPALPEAVKNLLALHSLEAWPTKYEEFSRVARPWAWKVIKVGEDHITARPLFTVRGSRDLDYWMGKVKLHGEGKPRYFVDFESYSSWTTRYSGSNIAKYYDELGEIEARIAAVTKFP